MQQDIFDIKFPIETKLKEEVITQFSNKQGGANNIFSQYWQPFVWAATIGFLRDERRPLAPGTERIFNMNIMIGNGGEQDAQALICMGIARAGSLDILKDPEELIRLISEYANGGFYHIKELIENGENTFNDMEKVKQEIFSRNYSGKSKAPTINKPVEEPEEETPLPAQDIQTEVGEPKGDRPARSRRWSVKEVGELQMYFKQGLGTEQLASFFERTENDVLEQLKKLGLI